MNYCELNENHHAYLGFDRYIERSENPKCDILIADSVRDIEKHQPKVGILTGDQRELDGYRTCVVKISCLSFGTAVYDERIINVLYNGKFNLNYPKLPDRKLVVADALKDCSEPPIKELSEVTRHYVNKLPQGWTVKKLLEYNPEFSVAGTRSTHEEIYRACDGLPVSPGRYNQIVHPQKNRFLSQQELGHLYGVERFPADVWTEDFFPPKLSEWLAIQCVYNIRGDWKEDDWEATFENGGWVRRPTHGQRVKCFDLRDFIPKA